MNCDQFYEYPYWGGSDSNATGDPNPRLEAYIAAARRGASVRILHCIRHHDLGLWEWVSGTSHHLPPELRALADGHQPKEWTRRANLRWQASGQVLVC